MAEQAHTIQFQPATPWPLGGVPRGRRYYGCDILEYKEGPRFRYYEGSRFVCSDNLAALKAYAKATYIPVI